MVWKFLLDVFFPRFCIYCRGEGSHLCEDCMATIPINSWMYPPNQPSCLSGLLCASPYQSRAMARVVSSYLNPPYLKDLSSQLAFCIVSHMAQLHNEVGFENFSVMAVPEPAKDVRMRGYRASLLLAQELASALKLPVATDIALDRNILLVDTVYTDGASMEQEALKLKKAGVREVWGVVACRR